jgi:thiamine-monophosphate kinase
LTPEFKLIAKYFTRPVTRASLGVGDDCALLPVSSGCELAVSTDTLVSGVHFFADANPLWLGHKALAVNLSDLASMGATPRYVTLALTLPDVNDDWLAAFAAGFFALADAEAVELVGGDTTRGPLSMTLTVMGEVEPRRALRRDGAHAGDDVWVSGELGGAALTLSHLTGATVLPPAAFTAVEARLHQPWPRIALGRALAGVASAAIDISDGLLADLGHICERSSLRAEIAWSRVPMPRALAALPDPLRLRCALAGGDDYELCFTAAQDRHPEIIALSSSLQLPLTHIGVMKEGEPAVEVMDIDGHAVNVPSAGYDHFQRDQPDAHTT